MIGFKRFVGLISFECYFWNNLLTAKATFWITWDTPSCIMIIFSFDMFLVVMDGIYANDLFQATFLKTIMGRVLKDFLQIWFACHMCQCFVRISFRFGNARLYVTDNGMHCCGAVVFDLIGKLSEFSVLQHLFGNLYQRIFL